jgi:putative protease
MAKKIIKKEIVKKVKKVTKKIIKKTKEVKPIGLVTHYFSNIKVAVIKLKDNLKEGQEIRIIGGEKTDFKQTIKSMQVDHKPVKFAKKGKSIGLKVKEQVREGYKVFKI